MRRRMRSVMRTVALPPEMLVPEEPDPTPKQWMVRFEEIAIVVQSLERIRPRDREVVLARFGNTPETCAELGARLNISPSRVAHIEARALREMRRMLVPVFADVSENRSARVADIHRRMANARTAMR